MEVSTELDQVVAGVSEELAAAEAEVFAELAAVVVEARHGRRTVSTTCYWASVIDRPGENALSPTFTQRS